MHKPCDIDAKFFFVQCIYVALYLSVFRTDIRSTVLRLQGLENS